MSSIKKIKISCEIKYSEKPIFPIINIKLYELLNQIKSDIEQLDSKKWCFCRNLTNDYEYICDKHPYFRKIPYMMTNFTLKNMNTNRISMYDNICSRSFFKLWEIFAYHKNKINIERDEPMICVCLAEGPGGFIQSILENRCNKPTKIYGITLRDGTQNTTKWNENIKKNDKVILTYGDEKQNHDGDLMNSDIIRYFIDLVNSDGKADIVTADGGYSVLDEDINIKEQIHFPLFYNEVICALGIQKKGGNFILKVYDMFTLPTCQLFTLLSIYYKEVYITKPLTSRPANSERYIVCLGFRGISKKELMKLYKNCVIISEKGIRYKAILDGKKYIPKKNGLFVSSIFKDDYLNENIKDQIIYQNEKYIPFQIERINQIIDLIKDMDHFELNGDIQSNSNIFQYYENSQNIKAIEWCRRNLMPIDSEYNMNNYI